MSNSPKIIGFLAAWIPFAFSVLIAFFPSAKEMKRLWLQWAWRVAVVVLGFLGSVMFWRQEELSDAENTAQTSKAIGTAVNQANAHSDEKFRSVNDGVGKMHDELGEVRQHVDATEKNLTTELEQATSVLTANIGKVGKPEPPEMAKLKFTLFQENLTEAQFPLLEQTVQQESDGTVNFSFGVRNTSGVQAEQVEIWVQLCAAICSFAKEPKGFDKPPGPDSLRHKYILAINPGVTTADNDVSIKLSQTFFEPHRIGVAFRATCKNCKDIVKTEDYYLDVQPYVKPPQ